MTNDPTKNWKLSTLALMAVVAMLVVPAPTQGASENTNLIQQILAIVQSIQTILVGTDGSVASLQSDVTAIKTKTDNLPDDTAAALNEIKAGVGGYGPLNRTLVKSFATSGGTVTYACTSTGPFLLHVHSSGDNATVSAGIDFVFTHHEVVNSHQNAYMVLGGDPGDSIKIIVAGGAFANVLITMQHADGQIASCESLGTT